MSEATEVPQGQAGQGADGVQDKAREAAGQAQEKAQEAAGQAKGKVRDQVDQRSTQAGEQVHSAAQDARSVAEELRSKGKEQPAKYAEQAADRVERLGSYLKDSDGDKILGDVEDFARRQPMAVLAGGLALGFATSRFLKASSAKRYQTSGGSSRGFPGQGRVGNGRASYDAPVLPGSMTDAPPMPPVATSPATPRPLPPVSPPTPGLGAVQPSPGFTPPATGSAPESP
jgi:hypothetical protein